MQVTLLRRGRVQRLGSHYARLASGTVRIDDPALPYVIEMELAGSGEHLRCDQLTIGRRPDGPDIGSERLRGISVKELLKAAASVFTFRLADPDRGIAGGLEPIPQPVYVQRGDLRMVDFGNATLDDALDWGIAQVLADQDTQPRRRRRITDDDLRRFAEIVRLCEASGRPYIATVMHEMGLSIDQARKWRPKAVAAGYLEGDT